MSCVLLYASCLFCKRPFSCNPSFVPSLKNRPICKSCIGAANIIRGKMGLEPLTYHNQAYEPLPENELRG